MQSVSESACSSCSPLLSLFMFFVACPGYGCGCRCTWTMVYWWNNDEMIASIPVQCPVRVVHAMDDEEVPFQLALKLVDNCASNDASVVLVKGSSHSMDREQDFKTMRSMIVEVIEAFKGEFDLRSPGSGWRRINRFVSTSCVHLQNIPFLNLKIDYKVCRVKRKWRKVGKEASRGNSHRDLICPSFAVIFRLCISFNSPAPARHPLLRRLCRLLFSVFFVLPLALVVYFWTNLVCCGNLPLLFETPLFL